MNNTKKKILIVDDQIINAEILSNLLNKEYSIIIANNGKEALTVLEKDGRDIICILLDIIMPVMDGFTFLGYIKKTDYVDIPIIVISGSDNRAAEIKALNAGAWDFIHKPYERDVVQRRVYNVIVRSQKQYLEKLQYVTTHDSLTGLYNRRQMFKETRRLLDLNPTIMFVFVRFDVKRFRLINSFYGEEEGNHLLRFIAGEMRKIASDISACVYGRVDSDVFSICLPYDKIRLEEGIVLAKKSLEAYKEDILLEAAFGLYVITDTDVEVETIYACASMASQRCKEQFTEAMIYYDATMSESLRREQEIISDMHAALKEEQFLIYLQPKFDLAEKKICGAEALVRWLHPEKGFISPSDFIPIFESNGFIYELDYYVWSKVCELLRRWKEEGKEMCPISVNLSRVDMYNPHIVNNLKELTIAFGIPANLLYLELTESAYMDNPDLMKKNVSALQAAGFVVMMDDFGSGYSSLNTLKDILVDILKIDLKFLQDSPVKGRGETILASVIRMAKLLDLPVIVEGVETKEQKVFLMEMGCRYVQGYYFAKPMSIEAFEQIMNTKN